jgi:hypothetical protein
VNVRIVAIALACLATAPTWANTSAKAETQEERQACMNDAFAVCGHAIPDRDRVAACLAQNLNRISLPCRTVMLRYMRPNAGQKPRVTAIR